MRPRQKPHIPSREETLAELGMMHRNELLTEQEYMEAKQRLLYPVTSGTSDTPCPPGVVFTAVMGIVAFIVILNSKQENAAPISPESERMFLEHIAADGTERGRQNARKKLMEKYPDSKALQLPPVSP